MIRKTIKAVFGRKSREVSKGSASFRAHYEVAGNGPRTAGWKNATSASPAAILSKDLAVMRRRVRFEVRNNALAGRMVDFIVASTVGSGIKPNIKDADLAKLWDTWVLESNANGLGSFYAQQSLAMRETVTVGEAFPRLRTRYIDDGLSVPLQVQVLPAEMVPLTDPRDPTKGAIRFDGIGRRVSYLMHKSHPGDGGLNALDVSEVPATSVCHLLLELYTDQTRGEPWLTRALTRLHDLDAFEDATLDRKKQVAKIPFAITSPKEQIVDVGEITGDAPTETETDEDGNEVEVQFVDQYGKPIDPAEAQQPISEIATGAVLTLGPGEDIKVIAVPDSGDDFIAFTSRVMREACAAANVPYDAVMWEASDAGAERMHRIFRSYFKRHVAEWRRMLVDLFCRKVWVEWLNAVEFWGLWDGDFDSVRQVEWIGEGFEYTHPVQDVQAAAFEIRNGLASRQQIARERGRDFARVAAELAEENAILDGLGLVLDSDPRKTAKSGAFQDALKSEQAEGRPTAAAE